MNELFNKISSYNIFNNLFPGLIFCYFLKFTTNVMILTDNWIENLIISYFIGMVISRIGSLIIEPVLKKIKKKNSNNRQYLLQYATYPDYIEASKKDETLDVLKESNNTYRTMLSTFVCLLFCKICFIIYFRLNTLIQFYCRKIASIFLLLILIAIFLSSHIKQTNYIRERVEFHIKK